MAYDLQPGKFSIFPNEKKDKDTQPDWKGSIKLPDGQEYYFDAWNNVAKNSGKPYIQGKIGNPKNSNGGAVNQPASYNAFPSAVPAADDDIPF